MKYADTPPDVDESWDIDNDLPAISLNVFKYLLACRRNNLDPMCQDVLELYDFEAGAWNDIPEIKV